jgi:hypothetical protein
MDLVETARGKVYSCECGKVIRLRPRPVEPDEPEVQPEELLHVKESPEAKEHRRKLRRRRLDRKRSENPVVEYWNRFRDYFGAIGFVLIGVAALWLFGMCLTVAFPPSLILMLALGIGLCVTGHIWLLVIAFQDSPTTGMLCIFIGLYLWIFALMNIGETWKPLLLYVLGIFVMITGAVGAGIGGALFYSHH